MRFKIDWASLIVGRTFTVFALFYFVFKGNFQVQAPGRAYIWRLDLTEGFLRYEFRGPIFGRAYTGRGLFSEFYGSPFTRDQIMQRKPLPLLTSATQARRNSAVLPFKYMVSLWRNFCQNVHFLGRGAN